MDRRFSDDAAAAATWSDVEARLSAAELYWITTVRADDRPHTTPTVGVWHGGAFSFCTGRKEQKHRFLTAARGVTGLGTTTETADAHVDKYGEVWRFLPHEEGFRHVDGPAARSTCSWCRPARCWSSRSHRTGRRASGSEDGGGPGEPCRW